VKGKGLLGAAAALLLLAAAPAPGTEGKADLVRWRSIAAGEAEAVKTGKPVLYFFTADWCGPCHVLTDNVFSEKATARKIDREFVPIVLQDTSREGGTIPPEMIRLARKFEVRGFPTLVVAHPGGKKAVKLAGWIGREKTIDWLAYAPGRLVEMEKSASATEGGRP
jgi:protein disulfide-isomerase